MRSGNCLDQYLDYHQNIIRFANETSNRITTEIVARDGLFSLLPQLALPGGLIDNIGGLCIKVHRNSSSK